jgi:nicotinamide-nucleotide amidase
MADANLKQTYLPEGARAIPNRRGTAPGVALEVDGRRIYALPGVPHEMQAMLAEVVLPELAETSGGQALTSRILRVVGMGESDVADRLDEVIADLDRDPVATMALLAGMGEVRVRITAKEGGGAPAAERIASVEERVRETLGSAVFGADEDTLESVVAGTMREKGLGLAVAESVTGGMVASRIVNVPGASKFLIAGFVAYTPEMKASLLGVPEAVLSRGTVSAEAAEAMAAGARERTGADVGLSTTGEAGPDNEEAPVGTIYLGLAWEGGSLHRHFVAPGGRETVRRWATQGALNLLRLWLRDEANFD